MLRGGAPEVWLVPDQMSLARTTGLVLHHRWPEEMAGVHVSREMPDTILLKDLELFNIQNPAEDGLPGILWPTIWEERDGIYIAIATPGRRLIVFGTSPRDWIACVAARWRGIVAYAKRGYVEPQHFGNFIHQGLGIEGGKMTPRDIAAKENGSDKIFVESLGAMSRHTEVINYFLEAIAVVNDSPASMQEVISDEFRETVIKGSVAVEYVETCRALHPVLNFTSTRRKKIYDALKQALREHYPADKNKPVLPAALPRLVTWKVETLLRTEKDPRVIELIRAYITNESGKNGYRTQQSGAFNQASQ